MIRTDFVYEGEFKNFRFHGICRFINMHFPWPWRTPCLNSPLYMNSSVILLLLTLKEIGLHHSVSYEVANPTACFHQVLDKMLVRWRTVHKCIKIVIFTLVCRCLARFLAHNCKKVGGEVKEQPINFMCVTYMHVALMQNAGANRFGRHVGSASNS